MKIMAVDFGDARTGLAVCDRDELIASPLCVISDRSRARVIEKIARAAREQRAELIVVGNPINMNGTAGPRSELCREIAGELRQKSGLAVELWDERSTTVAAAGILNAADLRGKKRKAVIDAVAAVLILENYMAYRKNRR